MCGLQGGLGTELKSHGGKSGTAPSPGIPECGWPDTGRAFGGSSGTSPRAQTSPGLQQPLLEGIRGGPRLPRYPHPQGGFAESGLSPVVVQGPQPSCPYGSAVTKQREKPGSLPLATKPKTFPSCLRCAEAVVGAPGVMNPPSSAVPGFQLDSNWRSAPILGADSLQGVWGGTGEAFPSPALFVRRRPRWWRTDEPAPGRSRCPAGSGKVRARCQPSGSRSVMCWWWRGACLRREVFIVIFYYFFFICCETMCRWHSRAAGRN